MHMYEYNTYFEYTVVSRKRLTFHIHNNGMVTVGMCKKHVIMNDNKCIIATLHKCICLHIVMMHNYI